MTLDQNNLESNQTSYIVSSKNIFSKRATCHWKHRGAPGRELATGTIKIMSSGMKSH